MSRTAASTGHAKAYRILYLEDRPEDLELLQAHLEEKGLPAHLICVETREAFERALEDRDLDLVLSDYSLPTFDGLRALDLCQARRPDLPFLLLSGTVGEDVAVESLKRGATDYFLKHRLDRLVPGIHRAMEEAQIRRDREASREALRRQTEEFRALAENIPDTLLRFDLEHRITYGNSRLLRVSGLAPEQIFGRRIPELGLNASFTAAMEEVLARVLREGSPQSLTFNGPFDESRTFEARLGPEFDAGGRVQSAVCVIRDITEARRAEAALEASEARYRHLFDQNPQPLWVYERESLRILAVNEAACHRYGYAQAEFLSLTLLDLLGEDDVLAQPTAPPPRMEGFRFAGIRRYLTKEGQTILVEVYAHDLHFEGREATLVFPLDITERRRAELALQASERLHRNLVDTLAEGVIVRDAKGEIIAANPRASEILGVDPEALQGRDVLDPQLKVVNERGEPMPPEAQPDAVAMATGRPQRNVVIGVRRPDGRLAWLQVNCRPFLVTTRDAAPGLVVSFSDITVQRTASEAIRLAAAERLELLEAAGVAKAVPWSEQHNHQLHIGESAPTVLGLGEGHLPGAGYLLGLLVEADRPLFLRAQAQARNGEPATFEARVMKGDQLLWTRWTVACEHGLLRGVVQDISEQHLLQDQLLQSQKLEILGSLVGGIAHDFNNLLMGILGHGQVLELEDLTASQRKKLEAILQASLRGRTLVGQLMNFGRRRPETRALGSLNHVVEEVAGLLEHALSKGIALRLHLDPEAPDVLMDANQIHQVVMNLAINARDALGETGTLTFRTGLAILSTEEAMEGLGASGAHAFLEVEDDGPGIPEAIRARIFEPFFTTKEPGKGTGLGLAVVRRVVDGHRGLLHCHSTPGSGTRFRILLPLHPGGAQGTVGLLDDPGRDRATLQAYLESEGVSVLASDHWEALRSCPIVIIHAEALLNGPAQASQLIAQAPGVKVLLASRNPHLHPHLAGIGIAPEDLLTFPYDPARILQILQGTFT